MTRQTKTTLVQAAAGGQEKCVRLEDIEATHSISVT